MLVIIVKQNSAPATPKHERRAETCRAAAGDDDIVNISHSLLPKIMNSYLFLVDRGKTRSLSKQKAHRESKVSGGLWVL